MAPSKDVKKKKKKGKKCVQSAKRREQKRLSKQRATERMKADPRLLEESRRKERERWHERVAGGKVKLIGHLNRRDQKAQREKWKETKKMDRQRAKDHQNLLTALEEASPPHTPVPEVNEEAHNVQPSTSRSQPGLRTRRRNLYSLKQRIAQLEKEKEASEKKKHKYRKKCERLRRKVELLEKDSPRKIVSDLMMREDADSKQKQYDQLLLGEVLSRQIATNFNENAATHADKRSLANAVGGDLVEMYGFKSRLQEMTSKKMFENRNQPEETDDKGISSAAKQCVIDFLETDKSSRMCAGKKETITRDGIKKQKRFLNDDLLNLHKQFSEQHPQYQMSYSTFCRQRPFWIVFPKARDRETCLCKTHSNMDLLVRKLHDLGITTESKPAHILKTLCCDPIEEPCLRRKCNICKSKGIIVQEFQDGPADCEEWTTKRVPFQVKDAMKMCTKTVKIPIATTKKDMVVKLTDNILKYMQHTANINHQYEEISKIKRGLSVDEILLHFDFSENYLCKYHEEIQSAHFGGSKPQVTIHTSVLYCHESVAEKPVSFGTLSDCNRHDPAAVAAHLIPVLEEARSRVPHLTKIHFLSDGPTTQYKNRKMFQLMGGFLARKWDVDEMHWHFSESSHGKGAADGVGAAIKRKADELVAHQIDIPDCDTLFRLLQEHCKNVIVKRVHDEDILQMDKHIPQYIPTFKGTMQIHELVYNRKCQRLLAKKLTCVSCGHGPTACRHYKLGWIKILDDPQMNTSTLPPFSTVGLNTETSPAHDALTLPDENLILHSDDNLFSFNEDYLFNKVNYADVYSDDVEPPPEEPQQSSALRLHVNDFVVVKVYGKKSVKHFVANITQCYPGEDCYEVRFMKKQSSDKFIFSKEDEATIDHDDIVAVLDQPYLDSRLHYEFFDLPTDIVIY